MYVAADHLSSKILYFLARIYLFLQKHFVKNKTIVLALNLCNIYLITWNISYVVTLIWIFLLLSDNQSLAYCISYSDNHFLLSNIFQLAVWYFSVLQLLPCVECFTFELSESSASSSRTTKLTHFPLPHPSTRYPLTLFLSPAVVVLSATVSVVSVLLCQLETPSLHSILPQVLRSFNQLLSWHLSLLWIVILLVLNRPHYQAHQFLALSLSLTDWSSSKTTDL